jgi:hypothetical protein
MSKPTMTEHDGSTKPMLPNEARLRNLTYCTVHTSCNFILDIPLRCISILPRKP